MLSLFLFVVIFSFLCVLFGDSIEKMPSPPSLNENEEKEVSSNVGAAAAGIAAMFEEEEKEVAMEVTVEEPLLKEELEKMTVKELSVLSKEKNLKLSSKGRKFRKAELIENLLAIEDK